MVAITHSLRTPSQAARVYANPLFGGLQVQHLETIYSLPCVTSLFETALK